MKPRERVLAALNHEEPDRVPLDLGGGVTTMNSEVYFGLLRELGFPREEHFYICDQHSFTFISESVRKRFQIDTRYIYFSVDKMETNPPAEKIDVWGVKRRLMGYFYEPIFHPLSHVEDVGELKDYPWPKADDIISQQAVENMVDKGKELAGGDYAVVFPIPPLGGSFELSCLLRGPQKFFADLHLRPKIAEGVMDHVADVMVDIIGRCIRSIGEYLDAIFITDDLGTQDGPMISPRTYRTYVKPRQRRIVEALRGATRAKVILHGDGAIAPLIDDLAEIGIAGIYPVQGTARGMDSQKLKERFGTEIVFWGAVDSQRVLPFGTVEDVRREVRTKMDNLGGGGEATSWALHTTYNPRHHLGT